MTERIITREYLRANPHHIFVFGDNRLRKGYGGAAALRDEPNTYGFITKKEPNNKDSSFYIPFYYRVDLGFEMSKLENLVTCLPKFTFLVSKVGSGLANKYHIWEECRMEERFVALAERSPNVHLLWK